MAFNSATERDLALKKIVGKAHTSPSKEIANESLTSGLTISSQTVFGQAIPTTPKKADFYEITEGTVEYLQLPVVFIPGTDTNSGRHSFAVKLPEDYESNTSNPKAGTPPFLNGQIIHQSLGSLQLIPTSFGSDYEAVPYYGTTLGSLDRIYPLDERDWSLDYFNGVLFQQDPPGAGDHAQNPTYVSAFIYIGDTLDDVINGLSGGVGSVADGSFITIEDEEGMSKERKLSIGTGLTATDGGENANFEISVDSSIVSLLDGSTFTGDVSFNQGLSGSLQTLQDGSSYLVAGNNIQIQSGTSGQVTISSTAGGNTGFTSLILGADTLEASTSEDINIVAGEGIQISANPSSNTLTFEVTGSTVTEIIKVGNMVEEVLTDNSPDTMLPFILSGTPVPASSVAIYINGIRLSPDVDFTYSSAVKSVTIPSEYNIGSRIIATYSEEVTGVVTDDDIRLTDDRTSGGIRTQSTIVSTSGSLAPTEGQVLISKSDTHASWGDIIVFNETPIGVKDDSNTDFTLSESPLSENDMMIFVNGLLQKNGTNFDVTLSGNTLTFTVPPNESDMISATYRPNYS